MIRSPVGQWAREVDHSAPGFEEGFHELAGELKGKVVCGKLNTDVNPRTPRRYGIMSIPTLLFYKDGQVVGKTVGALPKEYIMEAVQKTYGLS